MEQSWHGSRCPGTGTASTTEESKSLLEHCSLLQRQREHSACKRMQVNGVARILGPSCVGFLAHVEHNSIPKVRPASVASFLCVGLINFWLTRFGRCAFQRLSLRFCHGAPVM